MNDVQGVNCRVRGLAGVFEQKRVLPLTGWNIWNINSYLKNTYKKHIDNNPYRSISTGTHRITLEHLSIVCSEDVPAGHFPAPHRQALQIKAYSQMVKKGVPACSG
ncbi:hypothetical protein [Pseudomonas protegens]|uniref:hypothetical protein n=1 Tax=Pseudomonas protegens TaxID=380021 RepID=UPI001884239F|nr:hypothetical protein [Pseudomonas protegens]MBF0639801.1 hypothetical protein [Pseudomonas protegens]